MAVIRGEEGAVQFDAAGATNATIVGTRSWSLSITKDTLDTTKQGDTFRSNDLVIATCNFVTSGAITSNLE